MNVRLRHNMTFTAGVYYGGEMRMNNYVITVHMTTNSTDATSHNIAFERIKYFVYNKLDSSIFVSLEHQERCNQFLASGISVTTLPGEPVDQLVGLMLYYKLNAIMEERIIIDETEISSVLGENMIYLHSDNELTDVGVIPDWWTTSDPSQNDYVLVEADKVVAMHSGTAWREMNLTWPEDQSSTAETGNIVVFADFKPNNEPK